MTRATASMIAIWLCVTATAFVMLIDAVLFAAAMHKVLDGGWFPWYWARSCSASW